MNNRLKNIFLISKSSTLEILRCKDLYVLVILMIIYLLSVIVLRIVGIESKETVRFLLNLGLSVSAGLTAILTIISSSRQIPDEIENKTILSLFAKPLLREDFIIGKILSISLISTIILLLFFILTISSVPSLKGLDGILFLQVIILQIFSIVLLSSMGIFFSLIFPKSSVMVILIIVYFGRGIFNGILTTKFHDSVWGHIFINFLQYIPDFSIFNLIQRYTDELPHFGSPIIQLSLYFGLYLYIIIYFSKKILVKRQL